MIPFSTRLHKLLIGKTNKKVPQMIRNKFFALAVMTATVALLSGGLRAEPFSVQAIPSTLGPIPDGLAPGPGQYGQSRPVLFVVDNAPGSVGRVSVAFSANHSYLADLRVRLRAPDGTEHLLFEQTGVSEMSISGYPSTLVDTSTHTFSDSASDHWWDLTAAALATSVPTSTARTNKSGGVDFPAPPARPEVTSMDDAFLGSPLEGVWALVFDDGFAQDTGAVTAAVLSFEVDTTDIVVTNADDSGAGSLRQAMLDAGAGQTIAFDPEFFSTPRTINLMTALPAVEQSLNIQGPGPDILTVQRSASATTEFQPFFTTGFEGRFALSGMRISGGRNIAGGGVYTQNSSFRGSELDIDGNEARLGGGLAIADAQQAILMNTLIRANSPSPDDPVDPDGSGLFVSCRLQWDCSFSMTNSTVTGNAPGSSDEIASIVLSMGGGFAFDAAFANNTIVSDSTGLRLFESVNVPDSSLDVTVNSNIFNAPESIAITQQGGDFVVGWFCCNVATDGFFSGSESNQSNTDPQIQPLADNGGLTRTHAIPASSPAIDNGFSSRFEFDQRGTGFPRTFDTGQGTITGSNGTDSGAFEFMPEDRIFGSSFEFESEIIRFDNVNFTPNETTTGGSIRWIDGATCDCENPPFDFNIYQSNGELAFFWPGSNTRGGLTLDGNKTYALLGSGAIVGPEAAFSVFAAASAWGTVSGQDAYLGFRFEDNGQVKYGYARIETGPNGRPATIVSYAYENSGGPITIP